MSFAGAVQTCFRKYAIFGGRASRSEFWWWALFSTACSVGAATADEVVGADGLLLWLVSLVLLLPGMSVAVRRLHDTSRSAWWLLILCTPGAVGFAVVIFGFLTTVASMSLGVEVAFVGLGIVFVGVAIVLAGLVFGAYALARPSQSGVNAYGPQPGFAAVEAA